MHSEFKIKKTDADILIQWFRSHQRELPWRNTRDPYAIWISEIMLQQTRVDAVRDRFIEFIHALPTIYFLADVSDDRLMKLWEGMGYYSRARNLKKCALKIIKDYNASIPSDPKILQTLPGIGPYTAGAIASQAFGIPVPAVDGNVLRVLSRFAGCHEDIRQPAVKTMMTTAIQSFFNAHIRWMTPDYISHFNQSLMELGALICTPRSPACSRCPWQHTCYACLHKLTAVLPYRSPLKKRKVIERTLFVIRRNNQFFLHKRAADGLLADMYEFPGTDTFLSKTDIVPYVEAQFHVHVLRLKSLPQARHIFTHIEWHMRAFELQIADPQEITNLFPVTKRKLSEFAIPSAFKVYTQYYEIS